MKKFAVLALFFLLTACSSNGDKMLNEKSASYDDAEKYSQENSPVPLKTTTDETAKSDEDQDHGNPTENAGTTSSNTSSNADANQNAAADTNSNANNQSTMTNRTSIAEGIQLKDLAKEYSMAIIKTSMGDIKVKFYSDDSPLTVNNFMNLAQSGFYNGTRFHRVIKDFMIQGGDPNSKDTAKKEMWGTGGPDYRFVDEFNSHPLVKGSLAMANAGPSTNGSQFFIVTKDATPWLDGHHTNFGEVVEGMDVVDKIGTTDTDGNDRPLKDVLVNSIELVK